MQTIIEFRTAKRVNKDNESVLIIWIFVYSYYLKGLNLTTRPTSSQCMYMLLQGLLAIRHYRQKLLSFLCSVILSAAITAVLCHTLFDSLSFVLLLLFFYSHQFR